MKRSPLRRFTPLRSTAALKPGKRLRPMSKRRNAERLVRADAVHRAFVRDGGCILRSSGTIATSTRCAGPLDGHEPLSRARGGDPLDFNQIVTLCRAHHDWVHDHPEHAHRLGLLVHSWEDR